jgi:cytochrome c
MRFVFAGVVVVGVVLMGLGLRPVMAADNPGQPEFYTTKVEPILASNCYKCHAGMFHRGGLNLKTREGMLKGGHHGAAVVPGDPAKSLLVQLMRHEGTTDELQPMPPKKPKLSDADISVVEQWVKAGAIMPEGSAK